MIIMQVGHDVSLRWDLSTRQLVASADLGRQEKVSYSVQVYEEFVVVEYFNSFGVFTLNGKLLHYIDAVGGIAKKITVDQRRALFISSLANEDADSLSCLDLATYRQLETHLGEVSRANIRLRHDCIGKYTPRQT